METCAFWQDIMKNRKSLDPERHSTLLEHLATCSNCRDIGIAAGFIGERDEPKKQVAINAATEH